MSFLIQEKGDYSTTTLLSSLSVADFFMLAILFCVKCIPGYCFYTRQCPTTFLKVIINYTFNRFLPKKISRVLKTILFSQDVFPWFIYLLWPMVSLCSSISKWLTVLVTLHRFIAVCVPHKAAAYCTKSKALKHVSTIQLRTSLSCRQSLWAGADPGGAEWGAGAQALPWP